MKNSLSFMSLRAKWLIVSVAALAVIALTAVLLWRPNPDERLKNVDSLSCCNPDSAIHALKDIDPATLSSADRDYYDLLRVKVTDKAYVTHTSDSLILSVLSRLKASDPYGLYPEALYYGGRVYSDLGDKPTAIAYFEQALDVMPVNASTLNKRSALISQTGRLLQSMRLNSQAIPYLQKGVEMSEQRKDSVNLPYDYLLLGTTYAGQERYDEANTCYAKALSLCRNDADSAWMEAELASVLYEKDEIDSALALVRGVPERSTDSLTRSYCVAVAAKIYSRAGISDTALMYARRILEFGDTAYFSGVYYLLLRPEVRHNLDQDSVEIYFDRYLGLLEDNYKENDVKAVAMQNSLYNYTHHQQQAARLKKDKVVLSYVILGLAVILLLFISLFLWYSYRKAQRMFVLQHLVSYLQFQLVQMTEQNLILASLPPHQLPAPSAEHMLESQHEPIQDSNPEPAPAGEQLPDASLPTKEELEQRVNELLDKINNNQTVNLVPKVLQEADFYPAIEKLLETRKPIIEKSGLWERIETVVLSVSPNFKKNLAAVMTKKMDDKDYRLALLIKCEFNFAEIATLLSKAANTITYRRDKLFEKIIKGRIAKSKLIDWIRGM